MVIVWDGQVVLEATVVGVLGLVVVLGVVGMAQLSLKLSLAAFTAAAAGEVVSVLGLVLGLLLLSLTDLLLLVLKQLGVHHRSTSFS